MAKKRIRISTELRRELLVECGHKCTIHNCYAMINLEAHHINGNPSNNRKENLVMYCPTHHTMADRGIIDRKASRKYKKMLSHQSLKSDRILEYLVTIDSKLNRMNPKSQKSLNSQRRRKN